MIWSSRFSKWRRWTVLLVPVLSWLEGGVAQAAPGSALRFDGANGYVSVPHNTALNAYPLTVSAWFRTSDTTLIRGIASKYVDGSANGWAMLVQSGKLRVFYYRNNTGTNVAIDATSAATVADGYWHHAALVVDANGGKMYLDGVLLAAPAWSGPAGGPTASATDVLQIGHYSAYPERFKGDIDEVQVWSRALDLNELNYLKHRQVNGQEDGLVGLWHLNEGTGTTVADSTGHGYTGTLVSSPQWVTSTAPVVFNQVAGKGLSLDGVNDYILVPHTLSLNAFPLTVSAWFKTTRNSTAFDGIVSKYTPGANDGFALALYQGHVRAFYFKNVSNYVFPSGGDGGGMDAGFVADGNWHQLAFVVSSNSGSVYIDGSLKTNLPWVGTPGPPATSQDSLLIGRYTTNSGSFTSTVAGQIDEVRMWNRALSGAEVQLLKNVPLRGSESNLLAYWRLDEGTGATAADSSGQGHAGTLLNGPSWIDSTAFLGDSNTFYHAELTGLQWTRLFELQPSPTLGFFQAGASEWLRRLDDFGAPTATTSLTASIQHTLQGAIAGAIPLVNGSTQAVVSLASYNAALPQASAGGTFLSPVMNLRPQGQLDSVNDSFALTAAQSYSVSSGPSGAGDTGALAPVNLLHFNGNLYFGSVQTMFTNVANTPLRGAVAGGAISTLLAVTGNSGTVTANPAYHYGAGSFLSAGLLANGNAMAATGTVVNLAGTDTDCIQNLCYNRAGLTLSNDTFRGTLTLQFPAGFSVCTNFSPTFRYTVGQLVLSNQVLNASMQPLSNTIVIPGAFSAVEETKPFWMNCAALNWQVYNGQITFTPTSLQFVRQEEDDALTTDGAGGSDPGAALRVSNDGYYRSLNNPGGVFSVAADAGGLARLTAQVSLRPPELRPHFPYSGRDPSGAIPIGAGSILSITNGVIDTSASFLTVTGTVPAMYGRDCFDTNCSLTSIAPAVLAFSPAGNTVGFTVDGGLLAYGSVPPANLTWGYAGSGQYAQRTSDVQTGAYYMAGTFILSNQTALVDSQRPSVLLLSGFGDGSNPAYLERPGQAAYPLGLANYAGVNFRAPAQGQSLIANQLSAFYSLTPRSKYYARFGGVNGIHESQSFGGNLSLYGYAFTFTSYRLSYLDSENWESRTDGSLVLPAPAGFQQDFSRMKFLCKGGLDSAQLPPFGPNKHLVYWNADITPQSIEFHPSATDICGTGNRFLVMGVETKLPFIPHGFHATLGFQTNGNLVTSADNVAGVDSRFVVPGHLTLQGPGGSTFPLDTVGDGYFNNWAAPGRPDNGFFNLAGKLRVPFFNDVKVHLHVTPTSANNAQIDIMGGWPAADGNGQDQGWTEAKKNYFNTAKFDRSANGWPTGIPIAAYRRSATEQYHPRCQRDWNQVAKFDFPLAWNPVLHEFKGFADKPAILPVIDVTSRLKELSPGKVDFDFAQDISVQIPALKVLDFANDAFNEINAPINTVSNAIRKEFLGALNTAGLTSGLRSMQKTLREDASSFFRPIVQPALAGPVNTLYTLLSEMQRTNSGGFRASIPGIVTSPLNGLGDALQTINGTAAQVNSVFGTLNQTFQDVDDTLGLFIRILEKDGSGNRHAIRAIIQKLVEDQGPALGIVGELGDGLVNGLLQDAEPTLAKIQTELGDLRAQFADLKAQITGATGDLSASLNTILQDGASLNKFLNSAGDAVSNLLSVAVANTPDYFTADPVAAKNALSDRLMVAFLACPLPANYQQTFKQFMFDDNFLIDQLLDVLFDHINKTVRDGESSQIGGNQDGVFQAMKGVGALSQSLLSAKIRGAPTFEGDSLRRIHLDADVQMNLPDEMHFHAYMDIKELNSASTAIDCIPAGAPAAEVTLGAKDVPLEWKGVPSMGLSPLTLSVEARWTLQKGAVLGIGGLIDIKGEAGFKGCSIKEIGAMLAIGEFENYFAAKAAGTIVVVGIPVDLEAGIFAGHACTLDPLKFVDPEAGDVLGNPPGFRGVYVQYGGGLSLSEILLGTSTCFIDVEAGISTAIFYQDGPRSGKLGFRQKYSLDLSLLCLISGHADLALGGAATFMPPDQYQLEVSGTARLCGDLGPCPFCISGCKSLGIRGVLKNGGIDYFLDY